jgi:hypothetical protein
MLVLVVCHKFAFHCQITHGIYAGALIFSRNLNIIFVKVIYI